MLPLYKDVDADVLKYSEAGNQGLLYERFFDQYSDSFKVEVDAKTRFLNRFSGKSVGDDQALQANAKRREQLATVLNGTVGYFTTDWHFITGVGNAHPVENGFAWHPTLGTPYLAGSAVKGLLRAWVETCMEDDSASVPERVRTWFGQAANENGNSNGSAGELIFFDALPVKQPMLACDIMTPHMGGWYEKGGEQVTGATIPGDWHNPVPIPFLVTRRAEFLFAVAPRDGGDKALAEAALGALKDALAWLGAGAKTASGYGHMSFDASKSEMRESQARKDTLSKEDRTLEQLREMLANDHNSGITQPGGETKNQLRTAVHEASEWPLEKRQALLELTVKILNHHDGSNWKKKKAKAKELYRNACSLCE